MLGSSKLPVRMAGVSLSAALYAVEGDAAKADLDVEGMEPRMKSQVRDCEDVFRLCSLSSFPLFAASFQLFSNPRGRRFS